MGCDIHFFVERRVDGKWLTADVWENEYDDGLSVPYTKSFYHDRNYDLFAMLADVRNGRGFAGVKTGEGFVPIHEQRGIPEDGCKEYRDAAEGSGVDCHSHSWCTVAELLSYDWTQVTTKQGIVGLSDLARWKMNGAPQSWSGGVWGGSIEIFDGSRGVTAVENAIAKLKEDSVRADWYSVMHMVARFHDLDETKLEPAQAAILEAVKTELGCPRPHFQVQWQTPYYEAASSFLSETMPRLWRLGAPKDVRACFFFDN